MKETSIFNVVAVLFGFAMLMPMLMSSCTVIEPSERGVMVRLGQITSEKPIEPGIVWHYPFIESVEVFSIVPKTYEVTFSVSDDGAITKDMQTLGATVAVRYNYDESRIIEIVKKYKTSYIIEDAMNYVDTLAQGKKIERPLIGVQILDMTNKLLLQRYGINYDASVSEGIILVQVNTGYPASDAGLKDMDIITKINGEKVKTTSEFKYQLYKYNIGDTIEVTYVRNGKEKTTKVKLNKAN